MVPMNRWPKRPRATDRAAVLTAFQQIFPRLRRLVQSRLDPRLQGRVDPSDVLQDAFIDVSHRAAEFLSGCEIDLQFWLQQLVLRRLGIVHRQHLRAQMRDARREVRLYRSGSGSNVVQLAERLVDRFSSPSSTCGRAERRAHVLRALAELPPLDRQVITLRHIQELSNQEVSEVLGIAKTAASNRYVRALIRLRQALATLKNNCVQDEPPGLMQ